MTGHDDGMFILFHSRIAVADAISKPEPRLFRLGNRYRCAGPCSSAVPVGIPARSQNSLPGQESFQILRPVRHSLDAGRLLVVRRKSGSADECSGSDPDRFACRNSRLARPISSAWTSPARHSASGWFMWKYSWSGSSWPKRLKCRSRRLSSIMGISLHRSTQA